FTSHHVLSLLFFASFFTAPAPPLISTLSLHDALPISLQRSGFSVKRTWAITPNLQVVVPQDRSVAVLAARHDSGWLRISSLCTGGIKWKFVTKNILPIPGAGVSHCPRPLHQSLIRLAAGFFSSSLFDGG